MNAVFRQAAIADLAALLRLEQTFPGDRISRRGLKRLLDRASAEIWVAAGDAGVIAAAVVLYRARSRRARLYSLAVAPAVRGRGIGAGLLQAVQAAAVRRGCDGLALEVRCDNAAAIALYRKHGFRAVRALAGYYQDGQAALRMERPLGPPQAAQETRLPPPRPLAQVA